ncbi:MAG TPA: TPM domain-containing protein [Chitinophagaceae bacterium]|nr:TPM domain-containing protein [Chitinophagaceae bacterium]
MSFFPFFRKKDLFDASERQQIVEAVKEAERQTSGEIRVYVESRCRFVDPLDRAAEIFFGLKMDNTQHRNGVLVYVAMRDRQLAIMGDEGIHQKVGSVFWQTEVEKMIDEFHADHYATGIAKVVKEIGEALKNNFPYERNLDKNELPDDLVFGR